MIEIGNYNELKVIRKVSIGLYLGDGQQEILLPIKYVPQGTKVGDLIEVFVFNDNENRPIATTDKPFATVGEFACLKVVEVSTYGAFMDLGISKDLFVPHREQRVAMKEGQSYVVYIYIDQETNRLAASSKYSKFLDPEPDVKAEDEVQLLIAEKTDLGFKAIINNRFLGLLYKNEIFEPIQTGDKKRGYIKQIREEDGKIDLSLQPKGYEHIEDSKYKILNLLEKYNGVIDLGDKSSPDDIYNTLKLSKKAFKKTIGGLYKDQLITISDYSIQLVKGENKKKKS